MKKKFIIGTHDGKFHPDDVMAVAITFIHYKDENDISIIRSRNNKKLYDANIVFDVGENDGFTIFNHHAPNWEYVREKTGLPYASAGFAWRQFGDVIISELVEDYTLIQPIFYRIDQIMSEIDALDIGINYPMHYGISPIINSFVPQSGTEEEYNAAFNDAVDFTMKYLLRMIRKCIYDEYAKKQAWKVLSKNTDIVILKIGNPSWRSVINEHWEETSNVQLVIFPDISGSWRVQSAPGENILRGGNGFAIRCKAPEKWLGKNNFQITHNNKSFMAEFCHKSGFIGGAKTLDEAKMMAKEWLRNQS